ncbi:MAG: dipeptidase [Gemmatimonadota bacterium]|nr:dipeptidase [Gemmatimonadota bacterium]
MHIALKFLTSVVVFSVLGIACSGAPEEPAEMTEEELVAHAQGIHDRVLTLDTHDDIPFNFATEEVDPGVRGNRKVDLVKMREGGLDVGFFIVYVGQTERTPENYEKAKQDAMTKFDAIHRMTKQMHPDKIELAYTADDVLRIHESGKLVACIGIENGYVIGKDLALLEKYHGLGARYITLAHGGHNDIADSSTPRENLGDDGPEHDGVSAFGEEVIAEMNRLGIMVDVSHISKAAMLDAVRLSKAPVIASHSSTKAIADVARNMDDEQLLALKENGGVMQTVALGGFVKKTPEEKSAAIMALREKMGIQGFGGAALRELSEEKRAEYDAEQAKINEQWPSANLQDFADHIDHAVNLIGIEHVGISSDFDGGGGIDGWNDASETFNVTLELARRGYSEEDIKKLWGENLLRVWREVEKVAESMKPQA